MKKFLSISCLSLLLLSGCASSFLKSSQPPQTIYALRPTAAIQPLAKITGSRIMEIQKPGLPPGFDTARIGMYLQNGHRLDYYADAAWPSPLDEALQEFSEQVARKSMPSIVIASPGQSIDTDYRLQIKVNDLEPLYAGDANQAPLLMASLTFTLLAMPEERIVTSFTIDQQMQANSNNLSVITGSLSDLLLNVEKKAFETIVPHLNKGRK